MIIINKILDGLLDQTAKKRKFFCFLKLKKSKKNFSFVTIFGVDKFLIFVWIFVIFNNFFLKNVKKFVAVVLTFSFAKIKLMMQLLVFVNENDLVS